MEPIADKLRENHGNYGTYSGDIKVGSGAMEPKAEISR